MPVDLRAHARNDEGCLAEITWHNEKRAIRDLIPYEVNPRQITNKQAKDLKASLAKFGIADPLIINTDNMIIGGHQRKKILETLLGYDPDYQIDVRVPDRELSIDEARELNVRLNKNVADWDFDILANNFELDDLLDWGFDKGELDLDLWADEAPEDVEPQIDKAEELRVKWGVETGQLWQLGEHRLVCGDCTDKAVVDKVMHGERASCMWTDPPYGVDYVGKTKDALTIENDGADGLESLLLDSFSIANDALESGAPYYVAHPPGALQVTFLTSVLAIGWKIHEQLVWVKDSMVLGHSDYHYKHEPILYGWTSGEGRSGRGKHDGSRWYGDNSQVSVFEIPRPKRSSEHPTMKPPELVEACLQNSTQIDGIVYEPFSGSGTTLIACERLGRKCRAVEISPAYVAVAIQRWVDVTGGVPELLSS